MPIHINELTNGNFLDVHVSRILPQTDYECFVPKFEQFVQQHGKLRVLFADIERLAMVGDMNWRMVMALFCKPFMKATIHYFDHAQHQRPNQGIERFCPADRFFEIQSELRKIIEAGIQQNLLELALRGKPHALFN